MAELTVETINSLVAKFGGGPMIDNNDIVMSQWDQVQKGKLIKENQGKPGFNPDTYVPRYEAFEIWTMDSRVHNKIIKGSIDVSDPVVCRFDTDTDVGTGIQILGSPDGGPIQSVKKVETFNTNIDFTVKDGPIIYTFIRTVVLRYVDIVTLDFIKLVKSV